MNITHVTRAITELSEMDEKVNMIDIILKGGLIYEFK